MAEAQDDPRRVLGDFIRAQRQMANLSLRQLSALTEVSNPYLSQVERGLHEPSVRVLRSIANALNVSAETLLEQAGFWSDTDSEKSDDKATESAIREDRRLTESQRRALLSVYRSYVESNTEERS
jgi:transcriptional regulator with XRE-family HTH domain